MIRWFYIRRSQMWLDKCKFHIREDMKTELVLIAGRVKIKHNSRITEIQRYEWLLYFSEMFLKKFLVRWWCLTAHQFSNYFFLQPTAGGCRINNPIPTAGGCRINNPIATAGGRRINNPIPTAGGCRINNLIPTAGGCRISNPATGFK